MKEQQTKASPRPTLLVSAIPHPSTDTRTAPLSDPDGQLRVVFPLSDQVQTLLQVPKLQNTCCTQRISETLPKVIQNGQILWQSEVCTNNVVVKCSPEIAVKISPNKDDFTEYTGMQYVAKNVPGVPAPKPLGLITMGSVSYIFMSFIPGTTLDKVWPSLCESQKEAISSQLNDLFLQLRQQRLPDGMSFGGVCGEGCKDTRRHTRVCKTRISNDAEFEDFQFSNPRFGSAIYIKFLRNLLSNKTSTCLFSHGDIRPANIMVELQGHGQYQITGLLDWEKSGFYPEHFECTKATSTLSTSENSDRFLYLPQCTSPTQYPARWLLDRLWDKHVA